MLVLFCTLLGLPQNLGTGGGESQNIKMLGWLSYQQEKVKATRGKMREIQNFPAMCPKQVSLFSPLTGTQKGTVLCFLLPTFLEPCLSVVIRHSLAERSFLQIPQVAGAPWLGSTSNLNENCYSEFTVFPQVPRSLGPPCSQKHQPSHPSPGSVISDSDTCHQHDLVYSGFA